MFNGNRNVIIAIGLVAVIAVVIGIVTWPRVPSLQTYSYGNPANEQYRPGGSNCAPAVLVAIRDARKRLSDTEACQKEAEEYRQSSDDLVQQTRAADAAQAQAQIASQGLWTAWFQTIGGFITLAAAIAAATYARDAAREGQRAANEAELSRTSYIEGERAHLKIYRPWFRQQEKDLAVSLNLKNVGRGMAEIHSVQCSVGDAPDWNENADDLMDGFEVKIPADEEGLATCRIKMPIIMPSLIFGYVSYRTLTIADCRTYFCLQVSFYEDMGQQSIVGNTANVWMPNDT